MILCSPCTGTRAVPGDGARRAGGALQLLGSARFPLGWGSFAQWKTSPWSIRAGLGEAGAPVLCASPCPAPCLSFPFHCSSDCSLLGARTHPEALQERKGRLPVMGHPRSMPDPIPLLQLSLNNGPMGAAGETSPKFPPFPTGRAGQHRRPFHIQLSKTLPFLPALPQHCRYELVHSKPERCCEGVGDKDKSPQSGTTGTTSFQHPPALLWRMLRGRCLHPMGKTKRKALGIPTLDHLPLTLSRRRGETR